LASGNSALWLPEQPITFEPPEHERLRTLHRPRIMQSTHRFRLLPLAAAVGLALMAAACSSGPTAPKPPEAAPARIVIVSGDNQTVMAGASLPEPIVIEVQAEDSRPVKGALVYARSSGGVISPPSATTGADGRLSYNWELPGFDGQVSATFTVSSSLVEGKARATMTPNPAS
jgi:hypothetical protein